jgi:ketosteroid isomerase-like protein
MKWALVAALVATCAAASAETTAELKEQVRKSEMAFAKTMADRDLKAFESFVAEDTLFFGREGAIRGRAAVVAAWKPLYEGPKAPFSWEPDTAEVLDSGKLAITSGPVYDDKGQRFGTFMTIWERQKDGKWRVIFDKGCPYCPPPEKK